MVEMTDRGRSSTVLTDDRLGVIRDHAPEALDALGAAYDEAFRAADPELLALARRLITEMVDPASGPTSADHTALTNWRSGSYSPAEQACLAFTEQFAFHVADVNDEVVLELLRRLPNDEVYGLVNAIYVVDAAQRLTATVDAVFNEEVDSDE